MDHTGTQESRGTGHQDEPSAPPHKAPEEPLGASFHPVPQGLLTSGSTALQLATGTSLWESEEPGCGPASRRSAGRAATGLRVPGAG